MADNEKILFGGSDYTVERIDLSVMPDCVRGTGLEYLYGFSVVDNGSDYMAHPDAVLLKNGDILAMYPQGHGKGAVRTKISLDGGKSWTGTLTNTPASWQNSRETPTVYRLEFTESSTPDKLIMISGNPDWHDGVETTGGFNCSVSCDEGKSWSEFELFHPLGTEGGVVTTVALASLTKLKENGRFVDKWMGLFHDGSDFRNFKTILSFDESGKMHWSKPETYFDRYRDIELKANMCEVEVIRSDCGRGDELCLISRSNSKQMNSLISFSQDEGKTWSEPREAPAALNGERHKADYTPDGRLFITFRSIERGEKARQYAVDKERGWMSEGWAAWVGTYEDLKNGTEGQYRIKPAHVYKEGQTAPEYDAEADNGYCGNVVLADGTVVTTNYGKYDIAEKTADGSHYKTFICSKRINLKDIDRLSELLKG